MGVKGHGTACITRTTPTRYDCKTDIYTGLDNTDYFIFSIGRNNHKWGLYAPVSCICYMADPA